MKIVCITASYLRPKVLELYLSGIDRLRSQTDIELISIVAGDGADVCRDYDTVHIPIPNRALTEKFNLACIYARNFSPDYVCLMGSDDLMSVEVLNHVQQHQQCDYLNCRDIYFYAPKTNEMIYILSSHTGCCRFLRSDLLDNMDWQLCQNKPIGLDQHIYHKVERLFTSPHLFIGKEVGGICIDVKTEVNLHGFDKWKTLPRVDPTPVLSFLSDKEMDILRQL